MPDNTLEIAIKTILDATGGEMTIRQQKEIKKALEEVGRGAELTQRQFAGLERAMQNAGAEGQAALQKLVSGEGRTDPMAAFNKAVAAAPAAGAEIGKKAGEAASHEFGNSFGLPPVVMEHLGTIIGRSIGVTGLGTGFLSGGFVGAGLALGLQLLHKGFEALGEDSKMLDDLKESLREVELHGGHSLEELTRDVQAMAKVMAGDAKSASKIWSDALDGNFASARAVGIVIDETLPQQEKLAELTRQVALRFNEFSAAAVQAGPNVLKLKAAAHEAAEGMDELAEAARRAQDALAGTLKGIEGFHGADTQKIGDGARVEIAKINEKFAQGGWTPEQRDAAIGKIQAEERKKKFEADDLALQTHQAAQENAAETSQKEIEANSAKIRDARDTVAKAKAAEDFAQKRIDEEAGLKELGVPGGEFNTEAGKRMAEERAGLAPGGTNAERANAQREYMEQQRRRVGGLGVQEAALKAAVPGGVNSSEAQAKLNELLGPDGKNEKNFDKARRAEIDKAHAAAAEAKQKRGDLKEHYDTENEAAGIELRTKLFLDRKAEEERKKAEQEKQEREKKRLQDDAIRRATNPRFFEGGGEGGGGGGGYGELPGGETRGEGYAAVQGAINGNTDSLDGLAQVVIEGFAAQNKRMDAYAATIRQLAGDAKSSFI